MTPKLIVPADFADGFDAPEEQAWIAALPDLAARCLRRWDLIPDGDPMYGYAALVLPVRRADGSPAVLKLPWPHEEAEHEALALSLWDGDGAVRLLAHEPSDWTMLLERLDSDADLMDVPIDEAIDVIAGLMRRLDRPAPPEVRSVREKAQRWADEMERSESAVPRELVEQAVAYCRELGPRSGDRLVNEDLHFENVLRGEREPWLVIDPKPIAADREFGLIALVWNRPDDPVKRLATVAEATGADLDLARRWAFVRAVETWIDDDEHARSAAVAQAFAL